MKVIRPPLTEGLVEELSNWQMQLYIRKTEGNVERDGNRYQGELEYLRLGVNPAEEYSWLIGKFDWMARSINRKPWRMANVKLRGKQLPKEEFAFKISRRTHITLVEERSCAIRTQGSRLVLIFFSPDSENCFFPRNTRVRKAVTTSSPRTGSTVVTHGEQRSLTEKDWEHIVSHSDSKQKTASATHDLVYLRSLAPGGVVRVAELFPDISSLNGGGSKFYADPMKIRINEFFLKHHLPYKVVVSEKKRGSDEWYFRIVPVSSVTL
jgi:hypothetical protein